MDETPLLLNITIIKKILQKYLSNYNHKNSWPKKVGLIDVLWIEADNTKLTLVFIFIETLMKESKIAMNSNHLIEIKLLSFVTKKLEIAKVSMKWFNVIFIKYVLFRFKRGIYLPWVLH